MNKKQEEIRIIVSALLGHCCNTASYYCYGDIPSNKFQNACREYAGSVSYNECIGLTDETVLGSAKRGFLFTFDGFYYNGCSSITYYYEGIQFSELPPHYNLFYMNNMLNELYEASVKNSEAETFADCASSVIVDCASSIINDVLDESVDKYLQKQEEKEQEKNEEFRGILDALKSNLKDIYSSLKTCTENDFSELDLDEYQDYFYPVIRIASVLFDDRDMYESITDEPFSEEDEEMFDSMKDIIELLNDVLEDDMDGEIQPIHWKTAIKAFHASISSINDDLEWADEVDDMKDLFERSQNAIKKLQQQTKAAIRYINKVIELSYDEEDF